MNLEQEILLPILALDKGFEEYEFIHTYLGPKDLLEKARGIPAQEAYRALCEALPRLEEVPDVFPRYRRTYIANLVGSVLMQVDFFLNKQTGGVQDVVEKLMALRMPGLFPLEEELRKLVQYLQTLGFSSIRDFKSRNQEIRFPDFSALEEHIRGLLKNFQDMALKRYEPLFALPLGEICGKSQVSVERSEEHPCFYCYQGNFRGAVGLQWKEKYSTLYFKNFLSHEIMPGHHLYYLIRQYRMEQGQEDPLAGLDPFYSPENVINEGLAMNGDLIFGDLLDISILASLRLEKFLHQIFYNAWYYTHILQEQAPRFYREILRDEVGFSETGIDNKWNYYVETQKYYIPCYPVGVLWVSRFLERFSLQALPYLYDQHATHTLAKVEAELEKIKQ